MINMQDYTTLIRRTVRELNEQDANYRWSVKAINKGSVKLVWTYLDPEDGCFTIRPVNGSDDALVMVPPHPGSDDLRFVTIGQDRWSDAKSVTTAVKIAIKAAYNFAHHYY